MNNEIRCAGWLLKDKHNKPVLTGTEYETFRYEKYQISGGTPPHRVGSTGKLWVHRVGASLQDTIEMYPTVFGMRWVVDNSGSDLVVPRAGTSKDGEAYDKPYDSECDKEHQKDHGTDKREPYSHIKRSVFFIVD